MIKPADNVRYIGLGTVLAQDVIGISHLGCGGASTNIPELSAALRRLKLRYVNRGTSARGFCYNYSKIRAQDSAENRMADVLSNAAKDNGE